VPTLVLIDDDAQLCEVLAMDLADAGFRVTTAADGIAGLERIAEQKPDVVVTDVNMPRLDGFSLCKKLRAQGNAVPLVILTTRDSDIDEALGLELGADDYITKPFSTRVLIARLQALLRRDAARAGPQPGGTVLSRGGLDLDVERMEVRLRGILIPTTVTELRLLECLMRRPGVVFSRTQLIDHLRGDEVVVGDRLIDTYVRRLRRKLEAIDPSFDGIETVIGAGYRFRE
jgi:DNA-binding response OmpR family regulator